MKKIIKKVLKRVLGRYAHIKKDVVCDKKWFGTEYGGFYVNPDLINESSIIYSFGIGEDVSFDRGLIDEYHCMVFGFDPTPKSINWCEQQILPEKFNLLKYGLANTTGRMTFNLPKNKNHVSGSVICHNNVSSMERIDVDMKCFKDIVMELGHDKIDIVKMDIEGSEYDVLESIIMSGVDINQIVVEFHERFFKNGREKTIKALEFLKKNNFLLFAVSDSYEELSFVKKETFLELKKQINKF